MDKIIQTANPVSGVAVGQVASCDLALGQRYHGLVLEVTATGGGGITLVRDDLVGLIQVNLNGKTQRAHTALELDAINTKYGADFAALLFNSTGAGKTLAGVYTGGALQAPQAASQTTMYLPIMFAEFFRKSYSAREARAWPTAWPDGSNVGSFQLAITCPNTGNIASGYTMRVIAITDTMLGTMTKVANPQPVRNICKWYRNQVPYTGAGDNPIVNLIKTPAGQLALVEEMTLFCQAGDDIQHVVVQADSRQIRDANKSLLDYLLLLNGYNSALNNTNKDRFDLDFDYSDLPTDALALSTANGNVNTFTVTPTLTAAAAGNKIITSISQVYGPID